MTVQGDGPAVDDTAGLHRKLLLNGLPATASGTSVEGVGSRKRKACIPVAEKEHPLRLRGFFVGNDQRSARRYPAADLIMYPAAVMAASRS
jgi:hypothetical protein